MSSTRPPIQLPCSECRVLHDEIFLCAPSVPVFGVGLVCLACDEELVDRETYETHLEEHVRCDCAACSRHLRREEQARNARRLRLALEALPADPDEDIGF